ncbi:MAG: dihydroorotase, partial [Xanthomonadales bacterium]|nr:dihydroorotase [Xanthomonadales bacterium]
RERVLSKCGWSPFEGETFRSSIVSTLVNGQPVWQEGRLVDNDAAARLGFRPQR